MIQNLFDQVKLSYWDNNRAALKEVYALKSLWIGLPIGWRKVIYDG